MKRIAILSTILLAIVGVGIIAAQYFGLLSGTRSSVPSVKTIQPSSSESQTGTASAIEKPTSVPYKIEVFASDLTVPWSVVWTSPERVLVTERQGTIRVIENGKLLPTPLHTFPNVSDTSEDGLMGMAVDPDYSNNKYVYTAYAFNENSTRAIRVVRFKDNGTSISEQKTLLTVSPATSVHAGARVKFGPDNKLYITTGDATNGKLAQDKESVVGKILRINSDGSIPSDNPFPNSSIWSYGHRNPQGIDWDPATGTMYATEHGPSRFDGPPGGDEVNIIVKGANYGWPDAHHDIHIDGAEDPILLFTPAVAPGAGLFYTADKLPQFQNKFIFAALKGEGLIWLSVSPISKKVEDYKKIEEVQFGRIREVVQGPDGFIYFTSSNRDGRGNPQANDDKIYRIVPQ